jgi:hypothetical protein
MSSRACERGTHGRVVKHGRPHPRIAAIFMPTGGKTRQQIVAEAVVLLRRAGMLKETPPISDKFSGLAETEKPKS